MKMFLTLSGLAALTIAATGCGDAPAPAPTAAVPANSAYLASAEPAGGRGVKAVKQAVQDGDDVTVVGRIGGGTNPFVDGLAAFTIVDPAVPHCTADEGCPTPWDYCCHTDELPANSAMVKVVDAAGKPVPQDARTLLGVTGLSEVVVRGKAKRDDAGNLTVLAEKVYVKK